MISIYRISLIIAIAISVTACSQNSQSSVNQYDAQMADQLQADAYGMRVYHMALLKSGPNRDQDSATAAQIQAGHMGFIQQMVDDKKLVLAGPFLDNQDIKGIFLFATASSDEAAAWVSQDPAVISGRLSVSLHPWYGSAAIMQVGELHQKIAKESI